MSIYGFNCYNFSHNIDFGGSVYVSGTTCNGVVGAYTLNFGESICMDLDFPFISCGNPVFSGECNVTTATPTPNVTASVTPTPNVTPSVTPTLTSTPQITPSFTPTPSITSSPTPTPSVTSTIPPTPSVTPSNTPVALCPNGFQIDDPTPPATIPNASYFRITTYTGGTFNNLYFNLTSNTLGSIVFGTAPDTNNYVFFSAFTSSASYFFGRAFSGSTDLGWAVREISGLQTIQSGYTYTGDTAYGVFNSITYGSDKYPPNSTLNFSGGIGGGETYLKYYVSCVTPTPTATPQVTPTPTSTLTTPTPTRTSSPTPTPTSTLLPSECTQLVLSGTGDSNIDGVYTLQTTGSGVRPCGYIDSITFGSPVNYNITCTDSSGYTIWSKTSVGFGNFGIIYDNTTSRYCIMRANGTSTPSANSYGCGSNQATAGYPIYGFNIGYTQSGKTYPTSGTGGTITYTGCTPNPDPTSTPTNTPTSTPTRTPSITPSPTSTAAITPTPTSTQAASYSFSNCGVSNSSANGACSDAITNPKTLYSNCLSLSAGCILYYNSNLTNPVTELYVFALSNWDMDGTGQITGPSSVQC